VANKVTLGPYTAGEIPPPFTYTFIDADGDPISLVGYDAKLVWKRGSTATERNAVVDPDQTANPGQVIYAWVADDLETAGSYQADLWVGNGVYRFASVRLVWTVAKAVGDVPDI
jgi:hypothetical protein